MATGPVHHEVPAPDYGLDAPGAVRNLALGALACGVAGFLCLEAWRGPAGRVAAAVAFVGLIICAAEALYMVWSSRVGKLRERERLLDLLELRGGEHVLDVGCGRGLLLHGVARRLATVRATGVDIWSNRDQSGNSLETTRENARREGVTERVEIVTGDARSLPFADVSFDGVVSNLALHNIPDQAGRRQAVLEIARVLKPGGRCVLSDMTHAGEYAAVLRAAHFHPVRVLGPHFLIFPPVRVVVGRKV